MKRNTPRHPKTRALASALGVPRCTAVGILEMLWHATAQLTPRGDIGRLSNEHIAEEVCWNGNPDALIQALIETRWLDRCILHRLVIHDWQDHADQTVRRSKTIQDHGFALVQQEASEALATDEQKTSVPLSGNQSPETSLQKPCKAAKASDEQTPAPPGPPQSVNTQRSREGNSKPKRTAFPDPFPASDRAELAMWAEQHGFTDGQVDYAIESGRYWAVSNGKRKASWLRFLQGAMRTGWVLEGYQPQATTGGLWDDEPGDQL